MLVSKVDSPVDGKSHGSATYPLIDYQVSNLVGKVLTQLELMPLSEVQLSAAKSVFNEIIHNWFEDVKDNSRTAATKYLHPFWVVDGEIVYAESTDKLNK